MNPFKIDGPTCLQLSGGRTSAYMLWETLRANSRDVVDRDLRVCFENTGKEDEATLRFVRDIEMRWEVPVVWLEFREADEAVNRWTRVDFASASRNGEPFEAAIRQRRFLPNPVTRFCTVELKIRTAHRFLRSLGWYEHEDGWEQLVGIRADEPRRVAKIRARPSPETVRETMRMPLADAGITLADVDAFWRAQPFGLELPTVRGRTLAGNCDLCFLKPAGQVLSLVREKPERAVWWARMEQIASTEFADKLKGDGWRFRMDRPGYQRMLDYAADQPDMFDPNEEAIACFCGD